MFRKMFRGLIRSYAQSDEQAFDPDMKTRYYKVTKDKAVDGIKVAIGKLQGYQLCFEIKNAGELVYMKKTVTGRIQDITLTITKTGAMTTAVDIYSASRGSMGDFGSNARVIRQVYRALDQHFDKRD